MRFHHRTLWPILSYGEPVVYKLSVEAEHEYEVLIPERNYVCFAQIPQPLCKLGRAGMDFRDRDYSTQSDSPAMA